MEHQLIKDSLGSEHPAGRNTKQNSFSPSRGASSPVFSPPLSGTSVLILNA